MGSVPLTMILTPCRRRCRLSRRGLSLCALSKQGYRFLTSLVTTSSSSVLDSSTTKRSLRKFVNSSPKDVALNTLSHLLSPTTTHPHLTAMAYPLYLLIREASWFNWNAKLVADVVPVLYRDERFEEAETLIIETIKKLGVQERDVCNFYCYLIGSSSKHQLTERVSDLYKYMKKFFCSSSSVYVKKRAYASMISSLCEIGQPREAEVLMEEMRGVGLKLSTFEFRSLVYAYGRIGLFEDMKRIVAKMQSQGFELDTVCANMVLASLGAHRDLLQMVSWLQRMKTSGVPLSARTCNSVLNSCPAIMLMLQDLKIIPLSLEALMNSLSKDEADVVRELAGSSVLDEVMEWDSSELKLDLHGMHASSSYLIFLQWIDVLRFRFSSENQMVPTGITVICGSGKHSIVKGQSPVKGLIKEIILRMKCPLKIDRKNVGCFVAKGKVFRDWLYCFTKATRLREERSPLVL